jgi:hypothetical protein
MHRSEVRGAAMSAQIGKLLIGMGVVLVVVGALVLVGRKIPLVNRLNFSWRGEGWSVYVPLGTCILITIVLTLVLWLIRKLGR